MEYNKSEGISIIHLEGIEQHVVLIDYVSNYYFEYNIRMWERVTV